MKLKVGFICVHNSCRSQIAEAIARIKASDIFDAYSAGTEIASHINSDAVRLIQERYNVNILKDQNPKTLDSIPTLDIVITMGCNVECPWLPSKHREDWGLDDPSGKSDDIFNETINKIEMKIDDLTLRISSGEFNF